MIVKSRESLSNVLMRVEGLMDEVHKDIRTTTPRHFEFNLQQPKRRRRRRKVKISK